MRNEKMDILMYLLENGWDLPKTTIEENMKVLTIEQVRTMFNKFMGEEE